MKRQSLFLACLAPLGASAASVAWTSTAYVNQPAPLKNLMGVDQFDQSGTQIFAVSTGGLSGVLDQTVDITFAGSDANLDTSSMAFAFNGFHANLGAGNNNISRTGVYSTSGPATVSISNLTVGHTYRIQAFVYDGRGGQSGRTLEIDGQAAVSHATGISNVTWGDGSLNTGTFVADATSQDFTVEVFNVNATSAGGQLNAILLHKTAVPEPTSLLALAFGGLLALRRRR